MPIPFARLAAHNAAIEPDASGGGGAAPPDRQAAQQVEFSAFEHAAIGMAVIHPHTYRRLRVNEAFARMLGYTKEEMTELTLFDITHADDAAEDVRLRDLCLSGAQGQFERDKRYLHRDGRVLWGHVTCTLVRDAEGRPLHFLAQTQDITLRKQAEQALRESEERFRSLVNLSSDWYWEQDDELRFTSIAAKERENQYQDHDVLGLRRWELPGIAPISTGWEEHRRLLDARKPFSNFTYFRRLASGAPSYVTVCGEPVFDADGRFRGYRGTAREVTEAMLADQQMRAARSEILRLNAELEERVRQRTAALEAANRELESFSYSIAHDLRAPLGSIDGFSQVLEESAAGVLDGRNLHYLQRIRSAVRHMGELTNGLLALANLSRASLRREPVDLAALARAALDACRQQSPARQVQLVIADTLPAMGDPRLLAQVMGNLVGNAWKFTARIADARIEVGSTQEQDETVFFVRDNGAGFDMAHAGKLFEAFQRLHRQSEFEGTGIGLAIVHRIIGRHGGRIWAEAAPDRGACLRFTLPVTHVTQPQQQH